MSEATINKDKILLVKGIAGFGNRIQCLLTGLLYARLSGRRLIVDWSDHYFSNNAINVFHRFFQCPVANPLDEFTVTESVSPSIWRGHLQDSASDMAARYADINDSQMWTKFSIDLTRLDYQEDVLVMWTYTEKINLLRGHFEGSFVELASATSEAIMRKLLREQLTLHPKIREKVDQFKYKFFNGRTVGVHVRYSDHRISVWSILKRLDRLLKQEPDIQIFLATDNLQIKKLFERLYPAVITTQHWYPLIPGLPIHKDSNRPDPTERGIEALIDLYLLAECDYLIIDTSSSFAYVANLLSQALDTSVFNVRRRGKQRLRIRRLSHRLMLNLGMFSWGLAVLSNCAKIRRATIGFER